MLKRTGDDFGGKITPIQLTADTCDQNAPSAKLLKGQTIIYVNGLPVAKETSADAPATASPISGYVRLGTVLHAISGSINFDTGVVKLTSAPALRGNTPFIAEAVIDFENNKGIIPIVNTVATRFILRASPWKANAFVSTDSQTQMANEIGLNPMNESMLAVRNQFANERHYQALEKVARIGACDVAIWDFKWDTHGLEKNTRANLAGRLLHPRCAQPADGRRHDGSRHHPFVRIEKIGSEYPGLAKHVFYTVGRHCTPRHLSRRPPAWAVRGVLRAAHCRRRQ